MVDLVQLVVAFGTICAVDEAEVATEIAQAITQLFFSAENQQRFHGTAEELGLTLPMLKSLLGLEPGDSSPMRSLAEQWGCDASFVTVIVDGLEQRGLVERRIADYDRRIKTVELTDAGVKARQQALEAVYGPRAGFRALSPAERGTLAELLRKLADAQAAYDEELLREPEARAAMRRFTQLRTREFRGRADADVPAGSGWRAHLEQHREELRRLKLELDRVRAEVKAQARRPADEAKAVARGAATQLKGQGRHR
jgi:DNA-binding MarR family transcriptional regulator